MEKMIRDLEGYQGNLCNSGTEMKGVKESHKSNREQELNLSQLGSSWRILSKERHDLTCRIKGLVV